MPSRKPRPYRKRAKPLLEKVEQQWIVDTLIKIGGARYILGTRRPKGSKCPSCQTFVPEHQGTCQTPGVADVIGFLPWKNGRRRLVMVECKAEGGQMSEEQMYFRRLCQEADVAHVVGGYNAFLAWLMQEGYLKADQVPHYRLPASGAVTERVQTPQA